MTSFVAVNPNNSYDPRIFDQLLFLEKLKHNEIKSEMAPSFIQSSEFNSILKEFKRKRQRDGDQKKWECFLEKKQQEEVNKTISQIKTTFPAKEFQKLGNNNFSCGSLNSISNENAYCESGNEYTSHWLQDNQMFVGQTFHDYLEDEHKYPISPDLNELSLSFKNDYHNEPLTFSGDNDNVKNFTCNDEHNATNKMQYQCSAFHNEEMVTNFLNVGKEQNIFQCEGENHGSKFSEQISLHSDKKKNTEQKEEPVLLTKRIPAEFQSDKTTTKLGSESEVAALQKKEDNSFSLAGSIEMSSSQKTLNEIPNDKNQSNVKNSYINEPEENYCKNIAKRIQDIPGVDTELRKVEDIRIKMTPILLNIKIVIAKNINSPLSPDEDLERIKQRTLEFGARFKRNYLYRTNCEVNKLKDMMPSPILIGKKSKIVLMIQKLTAVHHAAIQALLVIEKQLQTISIFGKTQELLCSFYNCIYELTLMLKPFYGYLKTQVLDEVEKHLIETIKLLSELKSEEKFSITNRIVKEKKGQLKSSLEPPSWMKKSAALARLKFGPPIRVRKRKSHQEQKNKVLEPQQSRDSINSEQGEKFEPEQVMIRPPNFMMSVKQRPGAELRRANFNPIKTEEPKTMIEIISREGTVVENFVVEAQKNKAFPGIDQKLCSAQTTLVKDELDKSRKSSILEKIEPKNVKLVCIKSEDDDYNGNIGMEINISERGQSLPTDESIVQYNEVIKYRRAFKKFKRNIPLYEKNTLNTVVSMSETFLEDTITEVSKEINKMKISDLLGIVDEIETCEADLDSSI